MRSKITMIGLEARASNVIKYFKAESKWNKIDLGVIKTSLNSNVIKYFKAESKWNKIDLGVIKTSLKKEDCKVKVL
jgi:hypothetical protein